MTSLLDAQDGDHADGGGLILRVRGGAASWLFRYTSPIATHVNRKTGEVVPTRREIGIGSAHRHDKRDAESALRRARATAMEFAAAVLMGRDPKDEIDAQKAARRAAVQAAIASKQREKRTLGRVIREFHERVVEPGAFTEKYKAQWIASIENYLPSWEGGALWNRPIADVEAAHLRDFVADLQRKLPHTARKVRQRLDAVFEDAMLRKWCASNPAKAIRRAVRRGAPSMKHTSHRALPYAEAPAFMARLRKIESIASKCLQFTVLTASRTSEAINAEWCEFDLAARVWVVPAKRMKAGEEHRVDLSGAAMRILEDQRGLDDRWVFPSPSGRGKALSNMSMLTLLKRLRFNDLTTVHGLARGTFSTWANEGGHARPDVVEAALAHREADLIRAAYNRAAFIGERKALLAAWADFLDGKEPATNVLDFPQQRSAA